MQEEEKIIDFKSTMESLIEEEKPEISQEEAIKAYKEYDKNTINKKNVSNDDDEEAEDDEHLKRLKKELLESLERVNILAKKIFGEKGEKSNLKDIKIKEDIAKEKINQQKREDIINQMRETVQNDQERSREE